MFKIVIFNRIKSINLTIFLGNYKDTFNFNFKFK